MYLSVYRLGGRALPNSPMSASLNGLLAHGDQGLLRHIHLGARARGEANIALEATTELLFASFRL